MTRARAQLRYIQGIACLVVAAGCLHNPDAASVKAIDLLRHFDRAEKRPPDGFERSLHEIADVVRPSILAPVPSRMVWPLALPRHSRFHAFVGLDGPAENHALAPIRLRVGISDHRVYEGLADVVIEPDERRWIELRADLSAYAGWKWSLFYRPDRVTWRLVLAADATADTRSLAIWGSPEIVTDADSAREYFETRRRVVR